MQDISQQTASLYIAVSQRDEKEVESLFRRLDKESEDGSLSYTFAGRFDEKALLSEGREMILESDLVCLILSEDIHQDKRFLSFELPVIAERINQGKRVIAIYFLGTFLPEGVGKVEEWRLEDPVFTSKDVPAAINEVAEKLTKELYRIQASKIPVSEKTDHSQSNIGDDFKQKEPVSKFSKVQVEDLESLQTSKTADFVIGDLGTMDFDILLIPVAEYGLVPIDIDMTLRNWNNIPPNLYQVQIGEFSIETYPHPQIERGKSFNAVYFRIATEDQYPGKDIFSNIGNYLLDIPPMPFANENPVIVSLLHQDLPVNISLNTFIEDLHEGFINSDIEKNGTLFTLMNEVEQSLYDGERPGKEVLAKYFRQLIKRNIYQFDIQNNAFINAQVLDSFQRILGFLPVQPGEEQTFFSNALGIINEAKEQKISFAELVRLEEETEMGPYFDALRLFMLELSPDPAQFVPETLSWPLENQINIDIAIQLTRSRIEHPNLHNLDPYFRNLLRYIREPEKRIPIFDEAYRIDIASNFLDTHYQEDFFDRQVFSSIPMANVIFAEPKNRPIIYANILEKPISVRSISNDRSRNYRPGTRSRGEIEFSPILDRTVSTYHSDTVVGTEDQLNITPDVNSFAYLIASKKLSPPLSIGLFGDWGSGKSFFMHKLEEKINEITSKELVEVLESPVGEAGEPKTAPPIPFVRNIVQIKFNAWYYIDANLWASLVTTIFERLSSYVGNKTEAEQQELDLLRRLELSKKELQKAETEVSEAQNSLTEKATELKEAQKDPKEKKAELQIALAKAEKQKALAEEKEARARIQQEALQNQVRRILESKTKRFEQEIKKLKEKLPNTKDPNVLNQRITQLESKKKEYQELAKLEDLELIKQKIEELDALSEQQNQLFQDLHTTREQLQDAWNNRGQAIEEEQRLQKEINQLEERKLKRQEQLNALLAKDIYEEIKNDPKLKEFLKEAKTKLDITGEINPESVEEIQRQIDYFMNTRNQFQKMGAFISNELTSWKSRGLFVLLLLVVLAIAFLLPRLVNWIAGSEMLDTMEKIVTSLSTLIAGGLLTLSQFFKRAKPYFDKVNEGIGYLEAARDRFKNQEKREQELLDKQTQIAKDEYDLAVQAEKEARDRLAGARKKVEEIESEMDAIRKGKRLASFIEKRLSSNDYQQYLGLISLIRDDFNKLSSYLQDLALQAADDQKVERIVLYIDDLDRCPPDKVVDVLQAIHLILAFPLFVVVVGVDVRWISKSLIRRYGFMISPYDNEGRKTQLPAYYRDGATPYAYLEKIFQIPFRLKPLDVKGKKSMIEYLFSKDIEEFESSIPEILQDQSITKPIQTLLEQQTKGVLEEPIIKEKETKEVKESLDPPSTEIKESLPVNTGEEHEIKEENQDKDTQTEGPDKAPRESTVLTVLEAQNLKISRREIDFINTILPILGDSPRAVKRFVNVFRLLKSNTKLNDLKLRKIDRSEGVLTLLAIIIGAPSCAEMFFNALRKHPSDQLWEIISKMEVIADSETEEPERAARELVAMHEFFGRNNPVPEVAAIHQLPADELMIIAPMIIRFSFRVDW